MGDTGAHPPPNIFLSTVHVYVINDVCTAMHSSSLYMSSFPIKKRAPMHILYLKFSLSKLFSSKECTKNIIENFYEKTTTTTAKVLKLFRGQCFQNLIPFTCPSAIRFPPTSVTPAFA